MNSPDFYFNPKSLGKTKEKKFLSFGNYDGVHLGHQNIIQRLNALSNKSKSLSTVLTFYPHTSRLFTHDNPSLLILSLMDRIQLLFEYGVDCVAVQNFDAKFASLTADQFCFDYLNKYFNLGGVLLGYDLHYGANRSGSAHHMQNFCEKKGLLFEHFEPKTLSGRVISSTSIRKALGEGDISVANRFLGRPFFMSGKIFKGDQRGRKLGFPTANMCYQQELVPAAGVYYSLVKLEGDPKYYPAVMNCGFRPTISSNLKLQVEAHILDFNKDIYDSKATFFVLDFLRKEQKFSNIELLVNQIKQDVNLARNYFEKEDIYVPSYSC